MSDSEKLSKSNINFENEIQALQTKLQASKLSIKLADTEKLSSSLAVLAEIFEKMAETSIEYYRCFMIINGNGHT